MPHTLVPETAHKFKNEHKMVFAGFVARRAQEVDKDAGKASSETDSESGGARQLLGMKGASDEDNIWKIRLQLTKPVTWVPLIWGAVPLCSPCTCFTNFPKSMSIGSSTSFPVSYMYGRDCCEAPCRCWMRCSSFRAVRLVQPNTDRPAPNHYDHGRPFLDRIHTDHQRLVRFRWAIFFPGLPGSRPACTHRASIEIHTVSAVLGMPAPSSMYLLACMQLPCSFSASCLCGCPCIHRCYL